MTNTPTTPRPAELFLDGARGIYAPQAFAKIVERSQWRYISDETYATLEAGPTAHFMTAQLNPNADDTDYWHAWDLVLDDAETTDGRALFQSTEGDVWVVDTEAAIEHLNAMIAYHVEYEENHVDAGDGYAHLVVEGDTADIERRLKEYLAELQHPRYDILTMTEHAPELSPDITLDADFMERVLERVLDEFKMESGNIYGPSLDAPCFILEAYAVNEIEHQISASDAGMDGVTYYLTCEGTEAYFNGNNLFYTGSSACWYALIAKAALLEIVRDCAE